MKVRLTQKHKSGFRLIKDRKPKMDKEGKPIDGEFIEVNHRLSVDSFEVVKEPILDSEGKQMLDQYKRPKFKKIIKGKPFEVNDLDYVMKNHGAILEKA